MSYIDEFVEIILSSSDFLFFALDMSIVQLFFLVHLVDSPRVLLNIVDINVKFVAKT